MTALQLFLLLAGPFVGGYAATWAASWPRRPRPLLGSSSCSRCGTRVPGWRQAPVVGYAVSAGARTCCGGRIPIVYPVGEIGGLLIGLGSALAPRADEGALLFGFGMCLLYAALVDLRRFAIPIPSLLALGALLVLDWSRAPGAAPEGLTGAAASAALLGLLSLLIRSPTGRRGLALGDILLASSICAWVGWRLAPFMIFGAAVLGLIMIAARPRGTYLPFGPALACSGFVTATFSTAGL